MGIYMYFRLLNDFECIIWMFGKFKFEEYCVFVYFWKVVQYVKILVDIEELYGVSIDWKKLYEIISSYDYGEIFIGDIKIFVKYYLLELCFMLFYVEEVMVEYFINENIFEEFKDIFCRQLCEGKDDFVEGLIFEVVDKMDQVYEVFVELQCGNMEKEFIVMYCYVLIKIKNIDFYCVCYFLDNILFDMIEEGICFLFDICKIIEEVLF